jgi:hypothetical protein
VGRSRARDEDVAALDAAAAPVYEELRSDPTAD